MIKKEKINLLTVLRGDPSMLQVPVFPFSLSVSDTFIVHASVPHIALTSHSCCELILAWWYVHVSDFPPSPTRACIRSFQSLHLCVTFSLHSCTAFIIIQAFHSFTLHASHHTLFICRTTHLSCVALTHCLCFAFISDLCIAFVDYSCAALMYHSCVELTCCSCVTFISPFMYQPCSLETP